MISRGAIILALSLVTLGCDRGEKRALERDLAAAEASIAENEHAFSTAMAKASSITPGDEPCPYASSPGGGVEEKYAVTAMLDGSAGVVVRGEATNARSPRAKRMRDEVQGIRDRLAWDRDKLSDLRADAAKLDPRSFWTWDLVVVLDAESTPGAVEEQEGKFEGRVAIGRSYAFDYGKKAIVCAGTFRAANAQKIEYTARPGDLRGYGMVALDLEAQSLRAGRQALKAVR